MTLTTKHFDVEIPSIGFGTWQLKGDTATEAVKTALETGYRHIDTAQAYENEKAVGDGIQAAGTAREDFFLTTKVWTDQFKDGDLQSSTKESLKRLGVSEVDLLLLHWPNDDVTMEETIGALNDARKQGLTKNIGVSNFTKDQFDKAVELSDAPILVNQVEYHPFIDQTKLLAEAGHKGSALTAYCPLAQGRVFKNETIKMIAERYGVTPAQIVLRWFVQQPGVAAIPRSSNPEHIRQNFAIDEIHLDGDEMARISALRMHHDRIVDPDFAPVWDNPLAA